MCSAVQFLVASTSCTCAQQHPSTAADHTTAPPALVTRASHPANWTRPNTQPLTPNKPSKQGTALTVPPPEGGKRGPSSKHVVPDRADSLTPQSQFAAGCTMLGNTLPSPAIHRSSSQSIHQLAPKVAGTAMRPAAAGRAWESEGSHELINREVPSTISMRVPRHNSGMGAAEHSTAR